jgi:DNA-binding Lrp family transcriptional regulator
MSYKKTNHKNALTKLVKEKRMILLIDAASVMNVSSATLNSTSKSLEKEGKIKRQKIKVRYSNGNLNDAWLLYTVEVKQNEIIDYEKILINKPFESPLKQHHCYKKKESPVTSITVTEQEHSNIIDMQEYIQVNNYNLGIKEYKGYRVVTSNEISILHKKPVKAINQQFERNKVKLILNEDYFIITKEESKVTGCDFKKLFTSNRQKEIYLFTESGYLMLVKTFIDDLAWEVQRQLVNSYFKLKELKQNPKTSNLPNIKNMQFADILELIAKGMKDQNIRIDNMENKLNSIAKIING